MTTEDFTKILNVGSAIVDADNFIVLSSGGELLKIAASIIRSYLTKNITELKGDTGVGISKIEKTSTSGLVDTYTITYSDNTTETFNVTNGTTGSDGHSPYIQDGVWWTYDDSEKKYINSGVSANSSYQLTKANIEAVLTGDITSHNHATQIASALGSYYTKDEITSLLGSLSKVTISIVSSLPTTGESNVIYFVPKTTSETGNVYDEYMYINSAFELVGDTSVDLSGYLKSTDISDWAKAAVKPSYTIGEISGTRSGVNNVTTLASLPIDKKVVYATLSAATGLSLASAMEAGDELTIVCSPTATFTQTLPSSGGFTSMDGSSIDLTSGKLAEISILCYASGLYSISSKVSA